jgi:hypothetical protein
VSLVFSAQRGTNNLFSVATTSTRPAHVIKADVKRVLDRMQVQYREIRGGFECIHMPSIDLTSIVNADNSGAEGVPRRSVVRKGSRISFGKKGQPPKEGEKEVEEKDKEKEKDKDKERVPTSRSSLSFAGLKGQAQPDKETGRTTPTPTPAATTPAPGSPVSPGKTKFLPPIPRDFGNHGEKGTGVTPEVAEDVFENGTTNELCVRFEISIVKVSISIRTKSRTVLIKLV